MTLQVLDLAMDILPLGKSKALWTGCRLTSLAQGSRHN